MVQPGGNAWYLRRKELAGWSTWCVMRPIRQTRNMIVEHVWNLSFDTGTNVVDVYINYLRKKVDDGFTPKLIHTVRGVGYELRCPSEALS